MDHFKQTEAFMSLDQFGLGVLGGGMENDPLSDRMYQSTAIHPEQCQTGRCNVEEYQSDYGILNGIHQESPQFGTSGAMGFGAGGIGGVRQDIGHSMRTGFGRNVGNFYSRPQRRKFGIHPQRGSLTGGRGYTYDPLTPRIAIPGNYPYTYNYDPYPDQQHQPPMEQPGTPSVEYYQPNPTDTGDQLPPGMPWIPVGLTLAFAWLIWNGVDLF